MIGDIIKINGFDLLVLDEFNGNPFVIALNTNVFTSFDTYSSNYTNSIVEAISNDWLADSGIPIIERKVDLTTLNGQTDYGTNIVKIAPLTLDEYRKYAKIIRPNLGKISFSEKPLTLAFFWLITSRTASKFHLHKNTISAIDQCGELVFTFCSREEGALVPAFVIDKSKLQQDLTLKDASIDDLLFELKQRIQNK